MLHGKGSLRCWDWKKEKKIVTGLLDLNSFTGGQPIFYRKGINATSVMYEPSKPKNKLHVIMGGKAF